MRGADIYKLVGGSGSQGENFNKSSGEYSENFSNVPGSRRGLLQADVVQSSLQQLDKVSSLCHHLISGRDVSEQSRDKVFQSSTWSRQT